MILADQYFTSVVNHQPEMQYHRITRESAELLLHLQQEQVRFAHWKGNTNLLSSLAGKKDIEILVHPGHRKQFEAILRNRSYKKVHAQPRNTYPSVEDWIGLDEETGNLLHLHTHYDLTTGIANGKYLHLPWRKQFFRHLKPDKRTGWPIPIPEMEAIVLLIRIQANMLHKKLEIPPSRQKELQGLLSQVQVQRFRDLCRELLLTMPDNFDIEIRKVTQEGSVRAMARLSSFFYQQLADCVKNNRYMSTPKAFYYKHFRKVDRLIHRFTGPAQMKKTIKDGGSIIALVGSDGSGKSRLCNDLVKWLTFKIDAHYFYLGKRPFIRSYDQRLFSVTGFLFNNNILSRYFRKLAGSIYHLLLTGKKIRILQLGQQLRSKGSLVICDRFPQKDVTGFFDGPKLQSGKSTWFSRLEMNQFRKFDKYNADLVVRLNISPEVAALRKPEHDVQMIEKKCHHLSDISFGNAQIIDVDAERPYEQVLLDIKRKIWENL